MIGESDPYDNGPIPWVYVRYEATRLPRVWELGTEEGTAALSLWKSIVENRDKLNIVFMEKEAERLALSSVVRLHSRNKNREDEIFARGDEHLRRHIAWVVKYWDDNERKEFVSKMNESWKIFCERNPKIVEQMNVPRKAPTKMQQVINGKIMPIAP